MSKKFNIGMKVYDTDWYLRYNLSYPDAARCLKEWGVSFVLAQNRLLPMPDSAVKSEIESHQLALYSNYSDRKFRDALADAGIDYWVTVCMFFAPQAIVENPSLRPIGSDGIPMEKIGWYIGIPPSVDEFVSNQVKAIERAVHELEPDGIFMSFTRWPGFWELWMPDHTRADFPEYSFDNYSLERFEQENDVNLPSFFPEEKVAWIEDNTHDQWTAWKCKVEFTGISEMMYDGTKPISGSVA